MSKRRRKIGGTVSQGDIVIIDDGDGWIACIVDSVLGSRVTIAFGDVMRTIRHGDGYRALAKNYNPSLGVVIGRKFASIKDAAKEFRNHLK